MEQEIKKSYYAIIPANVRYDKELIPNAKLLYAEITSLCNEKGYCWAENSYFAELYNVSVVSISKWVNQLVKKEYITSEIIYKEDTKQILGRYLRIVNDPIKEKFNTPIKEKFKDNNKDIFNNKYNNVEKLKKFVPPTLQDVKEYCLERKNNVDPERFIDFYSSKGWLIGKNKMKDWKACVRTWEKTSKNNSKSVGRNYTAEQFNNVFDNLDEVEL